MESNTSTEIRSESSVGLLRSALADMALEAGPLVKLIGHSLASSIALVLLVLVLLIPIGVVKALAWAGNTDLSAVIHFLEQGMLYLELGLFVYVLLVGVYKFVACQWIIARLEVQRVRSGGSKHEH